MRPSGLGAHPSIVLPAGRSRFSSPARHLVDGHRSSGPDDVDPEVRIVDGRENILLTLLRAPQTFAAGRTHVHQQPYFALISIERVLEGLGGAVQGDVGPTWDCADLQGQQQTHGDQAELCHDCHKTTPPFSHSWFARY